VATNEQLQTPGWLIATLKSLFDQYHRIAQAHSTNNGLLVAQDRLADTITDLTARAQIKARIQADVNRQALIAGALRGLYASIVKGRDTLAAALRAFGVDASGVTGLSGLGIVPAIPIAVGIGLAAGIALAAVLWNATQVQRAAIGNNTAIINKTLAGQMSVPDALALIAANTKAADTSKDILGLKDIFKELTPVLGIVVLIMLLPLVTDVARRFMPARAVA
jgi:hypothetical protein